MATYKLKSPATIEAEQFIAPNADGEQQKFHGFRLQRDAKGPYIIIRTVYGNERFSDGEWIVTIGRDRYRYTDSFFNSMYEIVTQ